MKYIFRSKLIMKIPERRHWRCSGFFIVVSFRTFFWCFYCWLWTGECLLVFISRPINENIIVIRAVFRILSNIYYGTFCENIERLKAINCICKRFQYKYLTGPCIFLWLSSIYFQSQQSKHVINVLNVFKVNNKIPEQYNFIFSCVINSIV